MFCSSTSSMTGRAMLLLALPLFVFTACSKENRSPAQPSAQHSGSLKRTGGNTVVIWPRSPVASYTFTVTQECDCPYGTITCVGSSAASASLGEPEPLTSGILGQSDGVLYTQGASPYSEPPNADACTLIKGPDAETDGPVYYIKPSGGESILVLQLKGGSELPDDHDWFTYQEATDTWTWDPLAENYFRCTIVTIDNLSGCC